MHHRQTDKVIMSDVSASDYNPANIIHLTNVVSMLSQHRRRLAKIKTTLSQCILFSRKYLRSSNADCLHYHVKIYKTMFSFSLYENRIQAYLAISTPLTTIPSKHVIDGGPTSKQLSVKVSCLLGNSLLGF